MSNYRIVLVDNDENYLDPLVLKFIQEYEDKVDLEVITESQYMGHYFSTPKQIDILVINESLFNNDMKKHNIKNIFLLTEYNTEERNKIYKYSSVNFVFNKITAISNINQLLIKENNTNVVMFYSPIGGIGNTTIALGVCKSLYQNYKKVLYINTETVQSFTCLLDNPNNYFISQDLENLIREKSSEIINKIEFAIGNNGFDYLLPFKQSISSLGIGENSLNYLIQVIKNSKKYDYIIVDSSSEFTLDKCRLMNDSVKTIITIGQDLISVNKFKSLTNNMDCSDKSKFIFVLNKFNKNKKNELTNHSELLKYNISAYVDDFSVYDQGYSGGIIEDNGQIRQIAFLLL